MSFQKKQKHVFILVSRDLKVEFVKEEDNEILKAAIGREVQIGEDLTTLIEKEDAANFLERLKEGLSGQCFSFSVELADIVQGKKKSEVLLTPNYEKKGLISALGITLVFQDDFLNKPGSSSNKPIHHPEGKFEKLIREGVEMISFIDDQGIIKVTSASYFSMLGYTQEELEGIQSFSLIHPDDLPQLYAEFQLVFTQKKVYSQPYRIRKKDGDYFWLKSVGTNLLDDPEINGIVVNSTDVNELILAEQKLKSSELKYKFLFENNPAPMFVWDRDTTKIIATNERCEKLYGYTREEFLELTIFDIRPAEDHDRLVGIAREEQKFSNFGKDSFKGISKHIKKTGEQMDVEINAQAVNYEGKRSSLVLVHDVTQKVLTSKIENLEFDLMEKAIQVETEIKVLLENFLLGIENSVSGIRMSLMKVHKGKFLNFTSPLITKELIDYIEGMKIGPDEPCCGKAAYRGQRVFSLEIAQDPKWQRFKDASTGQGFKACYSIPILNSDKEIIATFTVYFLDQKEFENEDFERHQRIASLISLILENDSKKEDLRVSNQRFELVNLATNDALYDWDIQKDLLFWGKSYERFLGHFGDSDKLVVDWERRIHPDDADQVIQILQNELKDPNSSRFKAEYRIQKNDGSYAYVIDRGLIVRNNAGVAKRLIGALADVTLQRQEETRLKLLESVITHANDSVVISEANLVGNSKLRIIYVNEAFTKMTGYSLNEVLGLSPEFLHSEKANSKDLAILREAVQALQPCEITLPFNRKNGEEFWVNFSFSPIADSDGLFTYWISIQREVTQQKIEEERKDLIAKIVRIFSTEDRFNFALDQSLEHLVKYHDLDAGEVWLINSDRSKINLLSSYGWTDSGSDFFKLIDTRVTFSINEGLAGQICSRNEIIILDDFTSSKIFLRREEAMKSGLNTAFGIPLHYNGQVIGAAIFISQKEEVPSPSVLQVYESLSSFLGAEIIRKKAEDELSQIYDTAQDVISITGFDGKFKRVNQGMCRLLDYSEAEILSHPIEFFIHPEDVDNTLREFSNLKKGINTLNFVNRHLNKSGKTVWLEWNCTVVVEEELIYSVAKDITTQKELQNLLDSANKMAKIGFWEVNFANDTHYWSPTAKEIIEVSEDFMDKGGTGFDFLIPEAREVIVEHFLRCKNTGEPYDLELGLLTAKGRAIWIRTQGQAEIQNGVCKRVFGSVQDITALKHTQLHLKETLYEKDQILESIGDGFFSLDKNWKVTYWNKAAERLFGQRKDIVVGCNLREIFPKEAGINSYRNYKEALEQNKQLVFEDYRSDMETWFEVSVFPSLIGISVYFKDITLRKTTEELIRQSNERFEKVAEATHEAIWDWDIVQNKLYWGPGYKTLFGMDVDRPEISYESWEEQIHEADLELVKKTINSALEDKAIANFQNEYRFKKTDGKFANVIDRAVIIRDRKGTPIRMVGAIQDITDQKDYEISLKNLNEKLEVRARELAASNAELEQFAYVASHDLQEPLRMVTSFLTQLELKYENQLDERAKKYIYFAVDGAKRMRQIILDLLEFSRIGRIEGEKEAINLEEILAEVFKLQFNLIQSKNAIITWSDLPVIKGSRTQLLQVFQNLTSNAMKYSKEGVQPEVHISCRDLGVAWEFSVKDNGIGINEESFDKIFIIFQRLHAKDQFTGSGIGLAIVKKIVENYDGRIWVDSVPGIGSTFRFTLKK